MIPEQFQQLKEDGRTILRTRPAWATFLGSWVLLGISLFLTFYYHDALRSFAAYFGIPLGYASFAILLPSVIIVIITVLRRYHWTFELDQQHVRLKRGYLAQSERKIQLVAWVNIDLDRSILGRLFNYGSLGFWSGDEKSRLTWWGVSSPIAVRQYIERIRDGLDSISSRDKLLIEKDGASKDSRSLTDAKGLTAIALLNDGKSILTSEKHGNQGACLALYDTESLKLLREFVFADGVQQPNAISVVSDPDRVIIDVDGGLNIFDLGKVSSVGELLPMLFHNNGPINGSAIAWWQYPFLGKREPFRTSTIGIFDSGQVATVHCGIAAPRMPSQLISWDLSSFKLKAGPVRTPDVSPSPQLTDDMAGVPYPKHRQFITAQRYGWVHFWDIDTLQLVRAWRIESPASCDRSLQNRANNEIQTISLSKDGRILALGTWCGAIHIVNAESGKDVVAPLVPSDFDYTHDRFHDPHHAVEVTALQFFANDQKLIAGYYDGSLRVWDIAAGVEVGDPLDKGKEFGSPIGILCILHQLRKAISAVSSDYTQESDIRVWNLQQYF